MIEKSDFLDVLNREGFVVSHHQGNSMYPLVKLEDQLVLLKKDRQPKLYDIVVYKVSDNKYCIHRIIGELDDKYIIRGDNCLNNEYVKKDEILGYLDTIYHNDEEIKINDELNIKYYKKSCRSLPYRKGKVYIKNFIKRLIGYNK